MTSKTYGPGATSLCDDCRDRHARVQAEKRAAIAAERADMVQRFEAWLREAPPLEQLPDPVPDGSEVPGVITPEGMVQYAFDRRGRFVQVLSVRAAAEQCVANDVSRGAGFHLWDPLWRSQPKRDYPPLSTYQDVLCRYQDHGSFSRSRWTGSLYRLDDGRIVLYWHTSKAVMSD